MQKQLLERIENKTAVLAVVGLGYVGLPLAVEFARSGLCVIGVEVEARKVEKINRGESYIPDVDAVQVQIARNMLESGDWVTARLDGVAYLEKSPLVYWMMAIAMKIFGIHDWAARIPLALGTVLLIFVTMRFGIWAFGDRKSVV